MPDRRDRTDSLLDDIDALVDDSLEGGDQSGTFRGERFDKCTICGDDYHYLAITTKLVEMRNGSYGQDEFGLGIVDPDYSYQNDTSPIVCPGSNYLGPPVGDREWAWYLIRKRGRRPSPRSHPASASQRRTSRYNPRPLLPSRTRTWRFVGPYEPWVIDMSTGIEYVSRSSLELPRRVIGTHMYATFYYQDPHPIPSVEWLRDNRDAIERQTFFESGPLLSPVRTSAAVMKPIKFEYSAMHITDNPENEDYPLHVDFTTDYPIWAYQWWMPFWQLIDHRTGQPIPLAHRRIPNGRVVIAPEDEPFEVANEDRTPNPQDIIVFNNQDQPVYLSTDGSFEIAEGFEIVGTISEEGIIHVPTARGPEGPPEEEDFEEEW